MRPHRRWQRTAVVEALVMTVCFACSSGAESREPADQSPSEPWLEDHVSITPESELQCSLSSRSPWKVAADTAAELTLDCDVVVFSSIFYSSGHKKLDEVVLPFLEEKWLAYEAQENRGRGWWESGAAQGTLCPVLFTNEATLEYLTSEREDEIRGWSIVEVEEPSLPVKKEEDVWEKGTAEQRRFSRVPKLLPHLFFPTASYIAFFDTKREHDLDPREIVEYTLKANNATFSACWHPMAEKAPTEERSQEWLFQESYIILNTQKTGASEAYRTQVQRYVESDVPLWIYPEGEFYVLDTRAMFPLTLMCDWWKEYASGSDRDQPALAFTLGQQRGALENQYKVWLAPETSGWCRNYHLAPEQHKPGGRKYGRLELIRNARENIRKRRQKVMEQQQNEQHQLIDAKRIALHRAAKREMEQGQNEQHQLIDAKRIALHRAAKREHLRENPD